MDVLSPGWLTAISTLFITLGGGIAWLVRRHDNKKDPLPREQAEVAVAAANVGLLSQVNLRLGEDHKRLSEELEGMRLRHKQEMEQVRTELGEVRKRALRNDGQIADLQESHGRMKVLFSSATDFIEELLRWMHEGMSGTRPPLPANLRQFVDETLHEADFGSHRPDIR